ncbi:MAG: HAD family hydrolase [Spirochaetes bacterium]|nr:HAD family hydrolase [Spirochaetota bacterium]
MDNKKLILFFDCGDTIIDESTEVRNKEDIVISAELIPGADKMIRDLKKAGYQMILVADGYAQSFKNILKQHDLYDLFDAYIYSENIKVCKPDQRMFKAALGAGNLTLADCRRIAMVGNNLARDVKGANLMGMISIWISWSSRRSKTPADESEKPAYSISKPAELLPLVDELEKTIVKE